MGKRNKVVQIAILAVILIIGGFAIVPSLLQSNEVPVVGSSVPNIKLQELNGDIQYLSDYKGSIMVLNFWGTWCEPCKREMPAMQSAWEKWKDKGVYIVGINYGEDALVVSNFIEKMGVEFPMWLDSKKTAAKAFGIRPLPTTFFVQPDGKVHAIKQGEVTAEELDAYLMQMIDAASS